MVDEIDGLKSLQWSDELAYSAAKFVDGFYGCTMNPDYLAFDGNDHAYLKEIATFQNHVRLNFVPAWYPWSDPWEAIFDWLLDDDSFGHGKRLHLLSNTFNQIGIACSCSGGYGKICVVELGLNVKPTEKVLSHLIDFDSPDFD